jgi:hypothetical protein
VDILLGSADADGVDTNGVRLDSWTIHGGLNLHDALSSGVVNLPPIGDAGDDQTLIDGDGDGVESVALDGSGSFDPDGTVDSYEWREGSAVLATGSSPTVSLTVGAHVLTLAVADNGGATGTDNVVVTIEAPGVPADTVAIAKAAYNSRRQQLTVEATSSAAPDVTLTVYDASDPANLVEIGSLSYNSKRGKYSAVFSWPAKPSAVAVVSSGGGSDTSAVSGK